MKAHCLFEQSGTFKNEFKKLGIEAFDYDILNDYGQTDFQIDLFAEIEKAYMGGQSIFDDFLKDDIIMAFFPCTRFEDQIMLGFRGQNCGMDTWSTKEKLIYSMNLHDELNQFYKYISELVLIAEDKDLQLVIENPYSAQHYLRQYWCIQPTIIDKDRTNDGDWFKKPTQYFFINIKPQFNIIFEPLEYVERKRLKWDIRDSKKRSMIHPQYANRFIRKYLINYEQDFSRLYEGEKGCQE